MVGAGGIDVSVTEYQNPGGAVVFDFRAMATESIIRLH